MSDSQNTRRKDMPKAREIREFWAPKILALGKICDTDNILDPVEYGKIHKWQCFCCGKPGDLDRAHIKALSFGGCNDVSNLHMLCRSCHFASELYCGEAYWRWFLSTPFLSFMHPAHYTELYRAMGARDIHHATEIAVARFGTKPDALQRGVQALLGEVYDVRLKN